MVSNRGGRTVLPLGSCDCKPGIRAHKRCCDKVLPLSQFKLIWDLRPLIIQLLLHTPDDLTSSSSFSSSRQASVLSDDQKPEITTGHIAIKRRGWDPMMMMMMLEMNLMIIIMIMVLVKMMKVTMTMRIIIITMPGAPFQAPISMYDRL